MLKKSVMVVGLVAGLLAKGAWADDHGAASGTGTGTDRAYACSSAKTSADIKATGEMGISSGTITGHSSCDCSSDKAGSLIMWTCTVDAYWEKKK